MPTGVFGGGLYGIIKTTPIVDAELFSSIGFNSYIYDAEGNIIAELKRMKTVSGLTMRIYPNLIDAYVALEDKRFLNMKELTTDESEVQFLPMGKLLGSDVDIEGGST